MLHRKYIILRDLLDENLDTSNFKARTRRSRSPKDLVVDIDELSPKKAEHLLRERRIKAVAPVMPMKLIKPLQKGGTELYERGATWGVESVAAGTSPYTGKGVTVAVLDTGIDLTHPAFVGVNIVSENFTTDSDLDEDGHGTHCAGTIFGKDVDGLRIGIAREISKALIGKVLGKDGGSSDQIIQAIQWAVNEGADVISMSIGIDFPGYVKELEETGYPTELATSIALEGYRKNIQLFEGMATLVNAQNTFLRSILLIAAAGNESRRDDDPDFVIATSPPAVAERFISVAGVAKTEKGFIVASFSNTGARISAPGVNIVSAKAGGGLTPLSGTSMATPHVAGVAALWAQKLLEIGQGRFLEERLVSSAITKGMKPGFDSLDVGAGIVQAPQE